MGIRTALANQDAQCFQDISGIFPQEESEEDFWLDQGERPICALVSDLNGLRAIRELQLKREKAPIPHATEEDIDELSECLNRKGFLAPNGGFLGFRPGWSNAMCECNQELMGRSFTCEYFEQVTEDGEGLQSLEMNQRIYDAIREAFSSDKECLVTLTMGSQEGKGNHTIRVNGIGKITNPGQDDSYDFGAQDPNAPGLNLGFSVKDGDAQLQDPFLTRNRKNSLVYWWEEDYGKIDLLTVFIKCLDQNTLAIH